jgi:hypothetical protein
MTSMTRSVLAAFVCLAVGAGFVHAGDLDNFVQQGHQALDDAQRTTHNNLNQITGDAQRTTRNNLNQITGTAQNTAGGVVATVQQGFQHFGEQVDHSGELGHIAVSAVDAGGRVWEKVRTGQLPDTKDLLEVLNPSLAIPIETGTAVLGGIKAFFQAPLDQLKNLMKVWTDFPPTLEELIKQLIARLAGPVIALLWVLTFFIFVKAFRALFPRRPIYQVVRYETVPMGR